MAHDELLHASASVPCARARRRTSIAIALTVCQSPSWYQQHGCAPRRGRT
ncbi:hypothetical protein ACIP5N_22275 [Streptomyces sp. NPDC088768]